MHQSLFTYNLGRPYPFVWFTPVAVVGGILFTVLFSVINLATNGYLLTTIYTTKPNATLAEEYWFTKAPWSWGDKFKPSCQAQNIPIGYDFFTTNEGLSYTLQSVSYHDEATNETIPLSSLPYLNQTLDNCAIDNVILYMRKADQSKNGDSGWWSWDDSTGAATAHCTISTAIGLVNATFTTAYSSAPKSYNYVIRTNYTESSSMWWGTRLLNLYWASTLTVMGGATYPDGTSNGSSTPIWTKGQLTFTPNKTQDIKAYDFFHLQYFFLAGDSSLINEDLPYDILYNNFDNNTYSGPLTEGLTWAKTMYSTVLTDLGQTLLPNLLLTEDSLQWALQYPDDLWRQALDPYSCDYDKDPDDCDYDWINWGGVAPPGSDPTDRNIQKPMNESYMAYKSLMGPLATKNATIFSQYACSVPVRKDNGTLFLAILIADLVFLQALWRILNLVSGAIVARHDPAALSCEGHAKGDYQVVSMGMVPLSRQGVPNSVRAGRNESQQKLIASQEVLVENGD